MRLSDHCVLLEMRGKYLLMLPTPAAGGQEALQVNESFAFLWKTFQRRDDFTGDEIAGALLERYGLDPAEAAAETEKMIAIWKEKGLLAD